MMKGLDTAIAVLFTTRTWWQQSFQGPAPQAPKPSCDAFLHLPALTARLNGIGRSRRYGGSGLPWELDFHRCVASA
jgi:hypothetical protein